MNRTKREWTDCTLNPTVFDRSSFFLKIESLLNASAKREGEGARKVIFTNEPILG